MISFVIPTCRPKEAKACFDKWHAQGFNVVCVVATAQHAPNVFPCIVRGKYFGWPEACNFLYANVASDIYIFGGDDHLPPVGMTAQQCEILYRQHFPDLSGVCQPWKNHYGPSTVLDSPWVGTNYAQRNIDIDRFVGPMHHEYYHYFSDEELFHVAGRKNKLVLLEDVEQPHMHWTRKKGARPATLSVAAMKHGEDKALFLRRQADGFPCWHH